MVELCSGRRTQRAWHLYSKELCRVSSKWKRWWSAGRSSCPCWRTPNSSILPWDQCTRSYTSTKQSTASNYSCSRRAYRILTAAFLWSRSIPLGCQERTPTINALQPNMWYWSLFVGNNPLRLSYNRRATDSWAWWLGRRKRCRWWVNSPSSLKQELEAISS